MSKYHLAQVNIARMKASLEDPLMAGFVARLDEINGLADRSPGFVWRLQSPDGDATYLRPYDDDRILFNLSVWTSIEALKHFVYHSVHLELLRNKQAWFEKSAGAHLALWWIPTGHRPSVEEAKQRLAHLHTHGPTPVAFSFSQSFSPDERAIPAQNKQSFDSGQAR